jgi:uncharacterized membrane protein YfcA
VLELSLPQLVWIEFAVFAAFVIRGMSGFGAGLLVTPMLAFVLPVHVVVPTSGLLAFMIFLLIALRDRHQVIWRELKVLALPTLAGVVAGVVLLRILDNRLLVLLLGGFLVVYALYMMAVSAFGLPQFRCSRIWAIPFGFTGALMDTAVGGGGGAPAVIYMHARGIGRVEFRATLALLWLIQMAAQVGGYAIEGYYTTQVLLLVVALVPAMWLGTWLGERLDARITAEAFSCILAALLLVLGVTLILK